MTTAKKFGNYLKNKRLAENFSQVDVAEWLGVDRSAVSKWERGLRVPSPTYLSNIMFLWFKLSPRYVSKLVRRWGFV